MADLKITELPELRGVDLNAVDELAIADHSASETRRINTKTLIEKGIELIDDGTIPGSKIEADSITANEIAPDSITSSELADGAVDTDAIQDGAVTDDKVAYGIDGGKLQENSINAWHIHPYSFNRGINKEDNAIGHVNRVSPGTQSGITFDTFGHVTGTTPLVGSDLPIATETTIGGVSVPSTSGLIVSGTGALDHQTSIVAGTTSGITYDEHGHISAITDLTGADLPPATDSTLGGVKVPPGDGLTIESDGTLSHANSPVVPGQYPKVLVDQNGHVTAGLTLSQSDIPGLDASQITTGTFDQARIADRSIERIKLADYAISFIQEAQPPTSTDIHNGCLWYQESSAQLRMWNGNSWMAVGFGRLSSENLRFCGTWNASTGTVLSLTQFGIEANLTAGDPIPPASDLLTGVYLVTAVDGFYNGDTYDNGDWILCLGFTEGWVRIDTLSSAGGGPNLPNGTAAEEYLGWDNTNGEWIPKTTLDGGTY